MQANCPQCGHRITIDDAKVPDRPFQVKCPKCQTAVRFPGKAAAAAEPSEPAPPPEPAAEAGAAGAEEMRAQVMAQIRREMGASAEVGAGGRALVSLSDKGHAGALTLLLTRQGYHVDTMDDPAEAARLVDQGIYDVVAAARVTGQPGRESLYQRLSRLSPDARRRIFVVLVGDEFKTGDGTQAWVAQGDLVVASKDVATADAPFRNIMGERSRLYQVYVDARKRHESASA